MHASSVPLLRDDLARVQEVIRNEVAIPGGSFSRALLDLASRDAKLLRPAFTVLSARVQTGERAAPERVIRIAAAIELLHVASLIHDDIVDDARTRRGGLAMHVALGSRRAVLMGDFLFSRSVALVTDWATPENARLVSGAIAHIIGSEIAETQDGSAMSRRNYLRRIVGKTAVLFALCFHVGATESEQAPDPMRVQALRRVGYNIGVAFQIVDDILDIFGDARRTGKPTGTDLRAGVATLPIILGMAGTQRARVRRLMNAARATAPIPGLGGHTRRRLADGLDRTGALEAARTVADVYTARAYRAIDALPETPERTALREIAEALIERAS